MDLKSIKTALEAPFPAEAVHWKPQATNYQKGTGLAVAFADPRCYEDRLNYVCPNDWSMEISLTHYAFPIQKQNKKGEWYWTIVGTVMATCSLTICGVTRTSTGESPADDQNAATSAEAQAFKRACVKFGLGRYFYNFPKVWKQMEQGCRAFTQQSLNELAGIAQQAIQTWQQAQNNQVPPPPLPEPAPVTTEPPVQPPAQPPAQPAAPPVQQQPAQQPPVQAPVQPPAQTPAQAPPQQPPVTTAGPHIPAQEGPWQRPEHMHLTEEQKGNMKALKARMGCSDNSELDYYVKQWMPDAELKLKELGAPLGTPLFKAIMRDNVEAFIAFMDDYLNNQNSGGDF